MAGAWRGRVFQGGGKRKQKRREEKQMITLEKGGRTERRDNYVITEHKPLQKVYNKFTFLSAWVWIDFLPPLRLKIQDCRQNKFMWTYYSYREKSESRVLMRRGDKKVSNPAQRAIDSISYSGPSLPPVMVI